MVPCPCIRSRVAGSERERGKIAAEMSEPGF